MHVNELCENQHNENNALLSNTLEFLSAVRHSLSSFRENGTQYLPLMLGSTGEFHEKCQRGGCIFLNLLMGINAIIYYMYIIYTRKQYRIFKARNAFLLRHGAQYLQLFTWIKQPLQEL
jgi:hypothetical protein